MMGSSSTYYSLPILTLPIPQFLSCKVVLQVAPAVGWMLPRWDPVLESWVSDNIHSPCIDVADPESDFTLEPEPRGKVANLGAYGGTQYASKTLVSGLVIILR